MKSTGIFDRTIPMTANADILYIDTPSGLDAFCTQIKTADWIALDTEFLREKTYYPKLCLLQIATPDTVACIDPIALDDLSPLLEIIFDEDIIKVMHSGRQDMEIFFNIHGRPPSPVFDTQIAALLLGYADQIGYANLVREMLGVELDKLHTRADWSLRPLSADQLQYAADDVVYLADIYQKMIAQLTAMGRLAWLNEDFERLASPDLYGNPPEHAWLKDVGRVNYVDADDEEALRAFHTLTQVEGIMPALESSHALAYAEKLAATMTKEQMIIVNLSGRGDKDIHTVAQLDGIEI